jgi:hypothetical protein
MPDDAPSILLLDRRVRPEELQRIRRLYFEDMVKYVVDVERAEQLLLEAGSRQQDIWGANYYPGRGSAGCIEFTSLINIRPAHGNLGMELKDEELREKVRRITFELIGRGEER